MNHCNNTDPAPAFRNRSASVLHASCLKPTSSTSQVCIRSTLKLRKSALVSHQGASVQALPPMKAAQWAEGALTGFVLWVLISDLQFALRLNGFAQVLQALARDAAKPGDAALRRIDSLAFGSGSDSTDKILP